MAHRPSGTVTFLFTDIESSTERWERDGGAGTQESGAGRASDCETEGRGAETNRLEAD